MVRLCRRFGEKCFGDADIDWHRDPLSGVDWPMDYHGDINLRRNDGSDARVVWELNRLGHLITLGRAYSITKNAETQPSGTVQIDGEIFATEFFDQVASWRRQNPVARGVNFWWALAVVSAICTYRAVNPEAHGAWGVYIVALAGLLPCLYLHLRKTERSGFWQAAWVTSAGFGFIHTYNPGENWMGILAAATIGFVFCVSVRLTGSAWWAIGCHASWDWAESTRRTPARGSG